MLRTIILAQNRALPRPVPCEYVRMTKTKSGSPPVDHWGHTSIIGFPDE